MEDPLLTTNEHVTADGNCSTNEEHKVDIPVTKDSSSTPNKVNRVVWRNPCTIERVWGSIDLILVLVQIAAAILVCTRAKDEHPGLAFLVWIIGYACGCIVAIPFKVDAIIDPRESYIEPNLVTMIPEYFFLGWAALLSWFYVNNSTSFSTLYDSTQHFWLCVAFFAFSIIRYAPTHLIFAAICVISIFILWIGALVIGITPNKILYVALVMAIAFVVQTTAEFIKLQL